MAKFRIFAYCAVGVWLVFIFYALLSFSDSPTYTHSTTTIQSFQQVIDALQDHINEGSKNLRDAIKEIDSRCQSRLVLDNPKLSSTTHISLGDSLDHLRRRSVHYTREIWYAASAQLTSVLTKLDQPDVDLKSVKQTVNDLYDHLGEITRYLEIDLDGIGLVDNRGELRRQELDRLAGIVQKKLEKLQNPPNCSAAKILVVDLSRPCAFGCNVHHLSYCFQMAYATGRTLILGDVSITYTGWWASNFLPLSGTCDKQSFNHIGVPVLSSESRNTRIVRCEYISSQSDLREFLPPAIPKDLESDLSRLHDAPFVWFSGQLTAYLMRPKGDLAAKLDALTNQYNLSNPLHRPPVLGIHVRRTDKIGSEAAFHALSEYMVYSERRFEFWEAKRAMSLRSEWSGSEKNEVKQKLNAQPRRIFLASDDPSVIRNARVEFPTYEFYGDAGRAESAAVGLRMSSDSITGIALDILLLSRTDFLVCTFSSQVCRVAYELMQTRHAELGDASRLFQSLDDSYYFGGGQANPYEAIIADPILHASPGDRINIAGNHWDGYAKVQHVNGGEYMIRPAHRFRPRVLAVEMHNFDNT